MPTPFPNVAPYQRGKIHVIDHQSQALRDNPWGDPSHRDVLVYTPPGYRDSDARYPVVFVLAGFAGTGEGLLGRGLADMSIATRIDRLLADGCPPFIAVMPDCMTSVGGSQYLDSPGIGRYASYLMREIKPFVDGRFRTNGRWGATGRSSGGFGALSLAMDFPGELHAVGSLAGDMGFDLAYLGDISQAVSGVAGAGGLDGFVDYFWKQHRHGGALFAAMNIVGMSCAYSPDPDAKPIPARFPVDFDTGAVDFEVLQSWQRFDPIVRVDRDHEALRQLDLLFIDAGDRDEYNLHLGARRLVRKLDALGVEHTYEEFRGGHRGTSYRFDRVLPLLAAALG